MSNKQQTAVEWFAFELSKLGLLPDGVPDDIYKQAKEIEKERTIGLAQQVLFDFLELEENDRTHLAIKIWACDKLIEIYEGNK